MRKIFFLSIPIILFFTGIFIFAYPKSSIPISQSPKRHSSEKTICLNMIVKNESAIIVNCLASVKDLIDYWVIVDTGSSDGTQKVIKDYMKDIPGELHEHPWVNFELNRNKALELAKDKADYTLFMDADEVLIYSKDFKKPTLDQDIYSIQLQQKGASDSIKWFMINNKLNWQWKGVLHETITCQEAKTQQLINGVINYSDTSLGARSKDPKKYLHDAEILEKELSKDRTNSRYQFYLASSYLNAEELQKALIHYTKRADMQGDPGEVFISLLLKARLEEHFQMPSNTIIQSYEKARLHTPSRAEPLFYLGLYYLNNKKYKLAYETLKIAPSYLDPNDICFTERAIYEWRLQYFIATACLHLEKFQEMRMALEKAAQGKDVPEDVLQEISKNLAILTKMQ